jgi:hypothetical protein
VARSRSRRDEDEGGREKGRSSDGSTLLTAQWGEVEERGAGRWEVATRQGGAGDSMGDRRRGGPVRGGRHRPRAKLHGWAVHGRERLGRLGR